MMKNGVVEKSLLAHGQADRHYHRQEALHHATLHFTDLYPRTLRSHDPHPSLVLVPVGLVGISNRVSVTDSLAVNP